MKIIEEAFIKEGYVSIPFSYNGARHPIIKVTLANNVRTNILLDTGASANLLDYAFAKELELNLTPTGEKGGALANIRMTYSPLTKFQWKSTDIILSLTVF